LLHEPDLHSIPKTVGRFDSTAQCSDARPRSDQIRSARTDRASGNAAFSNADCTVRLHSSSRYEEIDTMIVGCLFRCRERACSLVLPTRAPPGTIARHRPKVSTRPTQFPQRGSEAMAIGCRSGGRYLCPEPLIVVPPGLGAQLGHFLSKQLHLCCELAQGNLDVVRTAEQRQDGLELCLLQPTAACVYPAGSIRDLGSDLRVAPPLQMRCSR
jgi:hypothetical protein